MCTRFFGSQFKMFRLSTFRFNFRFCVWFFWSIRLSLYYIPWKMILLFIFWGLGITLAKVEKEIRSKIIITVCFSIFVNFSRSRTDSFSIRLAPSFFSFLFCILNWVYRAAVSVRCIGLVDLAWQWPVSVQFWNDWSEADTGNISSILHSRTSKPWSKSYP